MSNAKTIKFYLTACTLPLLAASMLSTVVGAASALKWKEVLLRYTSFVEYRLLALFPNKSTVANAECDGYRFERILSNVPFAARDGAGAVVHHGKLYLIGGWNPTDQENFPLITSNDVWRSDDYGVSWNRIKENSYKLGFKRGELDFEGRHTAGYVSLGDYIYIVGGDANQGYHINDVLRSKDGKKWETVNKNPPWAPRALHITFVKGNFIYVLGGQTMPKLAFKNTNLSETYYRDLWRSRDGKDWEKVNLKHPITPTGGIGGDGFTLGDKIVIPGGFTYDNIVNKERDLWSTALISRDNPEELVEVQMNPASLLKFVYSNTATYDNKLWLIGGAKRVGLSGIYRNTNEVWNSLDGINWNQLKCSPLAPTHATSIWSTPQGIYVGAGNGWSKEIYRISRINESSE